MAKPSSVRQAAPEAVNCPQDLPEQQKEVWDSLAPQATAQRTLTAATSAAFRDLCEAIVIKRMMLAEILADGLTMTKVSLQMDEKGGGLQTVEKKAHPLLAKHQGMMVRVEAGMARFLLTATGKPSVVTDEPVDEFSEFDGPQLVSRG